MKYFPLSIILLLLGTTALAQDLIFSFAVIPSGNTAVVQIFAEKASPGTENMAGYTVNFYSDNTETTLTSFDLVPATSLGWNVSEASNLFIAANNATVSTTHTGYGTINVIDQNIAGSDIGNGTPIHILSLIFDHTVGDPNEGGSGFFAGTTNNHPAQEYVGNDFLGHPVVISGSQSQSLSSGALPVELAYFRARATGKDRVELNWQTSSEEDNDYFDIERSTDGVVFKAIDRVPGTGNSQATQSYQSFDQQPQPGRNYYRLKQVDFSGDFTYSDIELVDFKGQIGDIHIFPNPASYEVNLQFGDAWANAEVRLYDPVGQLVRSDQLRDSGQQKTLRLDHLMASICCTSLPSVTRIRSGSS